MTHLDSPVFICGAARSGTTMLLNLFAGHPEILVLPNEHKILLRFNARKDSPDEYFLRDYLFSNDMRYYHDQAYADAVRREDDQAFGTNTKAFTLKGGDAFKAAYGDHLAKNGVSLKTIYQAVARAYLETLDGRDRPPRYFVEKTPGDNEMGARAIKEAFPNARFIHILRDPRTRYASVKAQIWRNARMLRLFGVRYRRAYSNEDAPLDFVRGIAASSMISFVMAERNKHLFGDSYHVVRYEDLTEKPKEEMARLADFMGISFDSSLTATGTNERVFQGNSSHAEIYGGAVASTHSDRLAKYQAVTSRSERELVALVNKDATSRYGYEWRENTDFRPRDILRFLAPFGGEAPHQYLRNRRGLLPWLPEFTRHVEIEALTDKMIERWNAGERPGYS